MHAASTRTAFLTAVSLALLASTGCATSTRMFRNHSTGGSTSTGGSGGTATASGGTTATGGTGGTGGNAVGGASAGKVWDFAAGLDGWASKYAEPATLVATLSADSADGSPAPGSAKLEIPFTDVNQKVEVGVDLAGPTDLTGVTVSADVKLDSGLTTDVTNPGGIKLYVKSGDGYVYADGGYVNLDSSAGWFTIDLDVSAPPGFVADTAAYNAADIREIGVEVDTGGTGIFEAAVVHVDTVQY